MRAFRELDTERAAGMGLYPIPWSSIVLYGERAGLDTGIIDGLVHIIRALDGAYMKWHDAERQAEARRTREAQDG